MLRGELGQNRPEYLVAETGHVLDDAVVLHRLDGAHGGGVRSSLAGAVLGHISDVEPDLRVRAEPPLAEVVGRRCRQIAAGAAAQPAPVHALRAGWRIKLDSAVADAHAGGGFRLGRPGPTWFRGTRAGRGSVP